MLVESKGFGEGMPFSYWMTCGIEESIGGGRAELQSEQRDRRCPGVRVVGEAQIGISDSVNLLMPCSAAHFG